MHSGACRAGGLRLPEASRALQAHVLHASPLWLEAVANPLTSWLSAGWEYWRLLDCFCSLLHEGEYSRTLGLPVFRQRLCKLLLRGDPAREKSSEVMLLPFHLLLLGRPFWRTRHSRLSSCGSGFVFVVGIIVMWSQL